jgi:asparagine synthase (glutamine-hydrolysing)
MSVQFGRWNFEGQPPAPEYIERVSATLAPYGPDSNAMYSKGGLRIIYRAFHTTKESRHETQPHISPSGAVIMWDGRLDNPAELISELRDSLTIASTDVAIVAAAYEKWDANCLAKLIGDWALSIWNPRERCVVLAKDPVGTKHLYYSLEKDHVTWSTILDPLVLFAEKSSAICEEYIAEWFASMFPDAHLTPYVGIHAVPPSSSVLLRPGKHTISKYWDFDPANKIRYRTEAEYEEHFRSALAKSVQRRLRSERPVLAELSGGMDSSSIVCVADTIIARGQAECPRLDTITWYDESKPNWGELPHFTKVEAQRGRVGYRIDAGSLIDNNSQAPFGSEFPSGRLAATPTPNSRPSELFKHNAAYIRLQGYRVTLSGIGGGEVTGDGVPTPTPEIQNLLARARFFTLSRQLEAWAAKMRKPRLPLLWEAVVGFFAVVLTDGPKDLHLIPWFHPGFIRRNRVALRGCHSRVKLFGPLPSFQDNIDKLEENRRFLACCSLSSELLREVRYPYYDRDFLEFMYAIPREQIVRVGQRRYLMKHALAGIVPDEILNRRKKETAYQEMPRGGWAEWPDLLEIGRDIVSAAIGIVNPDRFLEAVQKARRDENVSIMTLKRTLFLESWLRHLAIQGVLTTPLVIKGRSDSSFHNSEKFPAPTQGKLLAG